MPFNDARDVAFYNGAMNIRPPLTLWSKWASNDPVDPWKIYTLRKYSRQYELVIVRVVSLKPPKNDAYCLLLIEQEIQFVKNLMGTGKCPKTQIETAVKSSLSTKLSLTTENQ